VLPSRRSWQGSSTGAGDDDRSAHGGGGGGGNPFPPGADDSLARLLPSAAELGLSMSEERPNARKYALFQ